MKLLPARIAATAIFALITGAITTIPAAAVPNFVVIDGITYEVSGADTATVKGYDPIVGGLTPEIAATVNIGGADHDVTTIGDYAFYSQGITSVIIPEGITAIDRYAFAYNNLTSVTIPDGVTTIGNYAFGYGDLTSVTIPNSVTTIVEYAFAYNNLTSVTIPDGVTNIMTATFASNNLTSVTIPDGVTSIGSLAFYNNNLTDVFFEGDAPYMGNGALGTTSAPGGPLVSFYARNSGFTQPTWALDFQTYRSQALATVTFDANGHGTNPSAVDVVVDDTVAEPADPTDTGYTFDGWFDAATGGNAFAFAAPITQDLTLFAQWSEVVPDPTPTPTPSPSPSATPEADTEVAVAAGEELADTGATNTGLIWTAGLLLAMGATTIALRARRTRS